MTQRQPRFLGHIVRKGRLEKQAKFTEGKIGG